MAKQVTHEEAIVPSTALTAISQPADLSDAVEDDDFTESTAEKILSVVESRAGNRSGSAYDLIIVLEGWAFEAWSDYDIASQQVILAGHVEDYSEKAYKVEGAFEVQMDVLNGKSLEEVEETYITSLVQQVDETDEDFHDEKGEQFLPKSAVAGIFVYES